MIGTALIDSGISRAAGFLGVKLFREKEHGDEFDFSVRLVAYPSPKGFRVRVADNYMAWDAHVVLDDFSLNLLRVMGESARVREIEFRAVLESISQSAQTCEVLLNRLPIDKDILPESWLDFEAKFTYAFTAESRLEKLVDALIASISLPLSLLQGEAQANSLDEQGWEAELEGEKSSVMNNKYERSRFNRAMCLKAHGFSCKACGEKLSAKYGEIAHELVHVHHIKPLSTLGVATAVDPIRDLVPLCPNCHNVIHRTNPPMSLQSLQDLISKP